MTVTIRQATEFDVSPMLSLWHELMTFHEQFDSLFKRRDEAPKNWLKFVRENIEKDNALVLLAEDQDILGYCQALITPYPPVFKRENYGELMDMVITPGSSIPIIPALTVIEIMFMIRLQCQCRCQCHHP